MGYQVHFYKWFIILCYLRYIAKQFSYMRVCVCTHIYMYLLQSLSHVWLFVTPWIPAHLASLSFAISQWLLKLMSIESVMPSNGFFLCHPLLLLSSIFPRIRVFSNESILIIRWPKSQSFSFSISPFYEYSVLTSFWMDWFDLLAVQGTLKILLQHHNQKASVLHHN